MKCTHRSQSFIFPAGMVIKSCDSKETVILPTSPDYCHYLSLIRLVNYSMSSLHLCSV